MSQDQNYMDVVMQLLASQPQYDKYGNVLPQGLEYQAKSANYQQDINQMMGDPLLAMYSGGGSFDPSLYQDVASSGSDSFDVPSDPLEPYLGLAPNADGSNSDEFTVAEGLRNGLSPGQIVARFGDGIDPDTSKRIRQLAEGLFKEQSSYGQRMRALPGFYQGQDGQWSYDGPGSVAGGKLTVPRMERSVAAKQFDAAGLPTPDQQFTQADFGYGDDRRFAREDQLAQLKQLQADRAAAKAGVVGGRSADVSWAGGVKPVVPTYMREGERLGAPFLADNSTDLMNSERLGFVPSVGGAVDRRNFNLPALRRGDIAAGRASFESQASQNTNWLAAQRIRRGSKGQNELKAMKAYSKAARAESDARRANDGLDRGSRFDDTLSRLRAEGAAAAGMTPLTLMAAARAKAIREMGG